MKFYSKFDFLAYNELLDLLRLAIELEDGNYIKEIKKEIDRRRIYE